MHQPKRKDCSGCPEESSADHDKVAEKNAPTNKKALSRLAIGCLGDKSRKQGLKLALSACMFSVLGNLKVLETCMFVI